MSSINLKIGEKTKMIRRKRKLSQRQLAQRLKTTQSVIARIETGNQNLTLGTLCKIASTLNSKLIIL